MVPSRSDDPSDQEANSTRLPALPSALACSHTASNRLTLSWARSGAKLRPAAAPMSTTAGEASRLKALKRRTARPSRAASQSARSM